MIVGIIHKGSGLGDSLFSYIATRVRAADLGVDYGFVGKEFFKGQDFMQLEWGMETNIPYAIVEPSGAVVIQSNNYQVYKLDKPYYDPEFNFIPDGSIIDGYGAQDIRYFEHRLDEVREWLKVKPLTLNKENLIINFRGGEYKTVKDLFLPKEYWDKAVGQFLVRSDILFQPEVHTDDSKTAKEFFPNFPIYADIGLNWRVIRYAKNLIISNSAFAIIPALLNENAKEVIAPFGWNARNASLTEWKGRPGNYYKKFTYV